VWFYCRFVGIGCGTISNVCGCIAIWVAKVSGVRTESERQWYISETFAVQLCISHTNDVVIPCTVHTWDFSRYSEAYVWDGIWVCGMMMHGIWFKSY
jgi:hypothetical protein